MKNIWIIILLAKLACINVGQAQQTITNLNYSVAIPAGDLSDYISKTSFRGFNVTYSYVTTANFGIGFEVGMHTFYERKDYDTYQDGTASWSGIQYRYTNTFPVMATISYFLRPEDSLNPYAGLGVGAVYNERTTELGLHRTQRNAWHFSLKPEIGVIYNFTPRFGAKIAAKYIHGFEDPDLGTQSFFAVDAGVVFLNPY